MEDALYRSTNKQRFAAFGHTSKSKFRGTDLLHMLAMTSYYCYYIT